MCVRKVMFQEVLPLHDKEYNKTIKMKQRAKVDVASRYKKEELRKSRSKS